MKRKLILKLLFIFILIATVVEGIAYIRDKDITSIKVNNIQEETWAKLTAYANGIYYFYEPQTGAIFSMDLEGEREKIATVSELEDMTAYGDNLYYADYENVYQYFSKTGKIISRKIEMVDKKERVCVTTMSADENYLYLAEAEYSISIYNAQNICDPINWSADLSEINNGDRIYVEDEDGNVKGILRFQDGDYIYVYDISHWSRISDIKIWEKEDVVLIGPEIVSDDFYFAIIDNKTGRNIVGIRDALGQYQDSIYWLSNIVKSYRSDGVKDIAYEEYTYTNFGGRYAMQCSSKEDDKLIILASKYKFGTVQPDGPLQRHQGDNIWIIDLEEEDTVCHYTFDKKNIVFYVDTEKYIVFHKGKVQTYDLMSQELLSEHEVSWFEKGSEHIVELCYDRWFIYQDGKVVDIIPKDTYLK